MPAIRFTRLIIEHTPLIADPDHMGLTIGQQMDNMIRASMERCEVIHEVALAFEDAGDFYAFRDHYMSDERVGTEWATASSVTAKPATAKKAY